jgi:hypothetical protein
MLAGPDAKLAFPEGILAVAQLNVGHRVSRGAESSAGERSVLEMRVGR